MMSFDCDEKTEELQQKIRTSNWMEELPPKLRCVPLSWLAIPGSHDSFTFYLDRNDPVAPDEPPFIQRLGRLGSCAKRIIYNWSAVQSKDVSEQLQMGVRYFDIRLATKPACKDLYCVHGLYGPMLDACLSAVETFLADCRREVVLLDFNHFYDFDAESHLSLVRMLLRHFGAKMCPVMRVDSMTLDFMWRNGFQVIVFYHNEIACGCDKLWPGGLVPSPWPNSTDVKGLLRALESNYESGRPVETFYVTQGVLTPTVNYVACHFWSTLKSSLAQAIAKPFVSWVKTKVAGRGGINVCILDFVELGEFVESVIGLNYALAG